MGSAPRILVADRDDALLEVFGLILEDAGYHVTIAKTVEETCSLLRTSTFDMVIAGSFTFHNDESITKTGPIRQAAGATPVLLCTAHAITPEEAIAVGFRGLIAKPFEMDELLQRIQEVLATHTPGLP